MSSAKAPGWGLAALAVLSVFSSIFLRVHLGKATTESPFFDALMGQILRGNPGEPSMQAPPLISLSHRNLLLAWAVLTGVIAVFCLVRAAIARPGHVQSQARAITIVVSPLALYCLWHMWPLLVQLARFG